MTNVSRVSEVAELGNPMLPSPLVGEGGARAAERRGRVRGNAEGLTKRQLLPATTVFRSRALRRNAGPIERKLRAALREALPDAKFRWQVPMGHYHVDFCSHGAKLIIEVDDASHAESLGRDTSRTHFLESEGYRVIRFWNHDVMANVDGVIAEITRQVRGGEQ
jgi:very-short-patch-repair endonuclease